MGQCVALLDMVSISSRIGYGKIELMQVHVGPYWTWFIEAAD